MVVWFVLYGLVIGSFLNVCIYRIPRGISVAKGRSRCTSCGHVLGVLDLIPVFSFIFLRGRCRYCKSHFSPRYALVELLTGFLFALCYIFSFGFYAAVLACMLVSVLVVVSFIDIDTKEIPDRLHIIILGLALVNMFVEVDADIYIKLFGLVIVSVPMLLVALLTRGFGGGDIKLMACTGLYLGAWNILLAFFIGTFVCAIYAVCLLMLRKAGRKTEIAFGQFLSLGIAVALLFGDKLIEYYIFFM